MSMDAAPRGSKTRFREMYEALRSRISLLDYEPGQRLSEEALAAEFGVSRTPIRRVLARLEDEGLVKSVQSVGTIVTDVDLEALGQVYELRMELAELIGRLAPQPPDPEVLGQMRQILKRCDALIARPDPRAFARSNVDFFHSLQALSGNQPFREIEERLYYATHRIWVKSVPLMNLPDEIAIFRREVADVLTAVEIGDLSAVGHIRRSHISMSFARLKLSRAP